MGRSLVARHPELVVWSQSQPEEEHDALDIQSTNDSTQANRIDRSPTQQHMKYHSSGFLGHQQARLWTEVEVDLVTNIELT